MVVLTWWLDFTLVLPILFLVLHQMVQCTIHIKLINHLEVKCPYTCRDFLPEEGCSISGFCCAYDPATSTLKLKSSHAYFAQVQGQMAIGGRMWCDFVIFTRKGVHIQQIMFDKGYWTEQLLPKLEAFYDNCFAPELVSHIHALGLPMRDLSKII